MNIHKISAATIARTACLLLALTNQVLSACPSRARPWSSWSPPASPPWPRW